MFSPMLDSLFLIVLFGNRGRTGLLPLMGCRCDVVENDGSVVGHSQVCREPPVWPDLHVGDPPHPPRFSPDIIDLGRLLLNASPTLRSQVGVLPALALVVPTTSWIYHIALRFLGYPSPFPGRPCSPRTRATLCKLLHPQLTQ